MDIELTVRSAKGSLPGWRYQVGSGDLNVAASDTATVTIADGTDVTLRVVPPAPKAPAPAWRDDPSAYWPVELPITFRGGTANVGDPYHQVDVSRAGGLKLSVVLSRVRDATNLFDDLGLRAYFPAENTASFLYARRNGPRAAGPKPEDLIDESSQIRRVAPLSATSTDDDFLLFELAPPRKMVGKDEKLDKGFRPKLVAAYAGTAVTSGRFLVYYYPQIDQDAHLLAGKETNNLRRDSDDPFDGRLGQNHYPNAKVHLWKMAFGKLFYKQEDPWFARRKFRAGLSHQVAATARTLGIVIPFVDLEPTAFADGGTTSLALGVAVFPEDLAEIVREIWSYVQSSRLRRGYASATAARVKAAQDAATAARAHAKEAADAASRWPGGIAGIGAALGATAAEAVASATAAAAVDSANRPAVADVRKNASIERILVAAFSNGNHYLSQLAKRIAALTSPTSLPFREFCSLDPPPLYKIVEQHVRNACAKIPESRYYYYWKYDYSIDTQEGGAARKLAGGTSIYQAILDSRFFYAHLPAAAWPVTPNDDLDMHAWIDATMVCDALKCGLFPIDPTKAVP